MIETGARFRDGFETGRLDPDRWIPAYLPQWTTPERSAARYRIEDGRLVLEITGATEPWCPEHDGETRVSSIQTGVFAGPLGSPVGQHRFAEDLTVVSEQPTRRLFVARFGRVAIRASALADPTAMVALWMIGFEEQPGESGEICVMEVFGRDVGTRRALVGMGVRPHADARLIDDFERTPVDLDVTTAHDYVMDWRPDGISWAIDQRVVRTSAQSPAYPMQLMLGLYAAAPRGPTAEPLRFVVDHVRADPLAAEGATA